MGFLSYAQNFEDVMLWRALGHVQQGLYVDVGAQHPRIDSISRAFYERGWRGIHVEPVPAFADMLRQDRPDETVLQVALGAAEGFLELNVFPDTGLSTAIPGYAERHRLERGYATERITVPMLTLESALAALAGKDVHWLKIDVEGFEEQVLRGWDSTRLRPWVLVIEATIPNSPATDHEKWEHLVTAAGYRYVYFDGLNRFYIAGEHPELARAFAVPPNIFDAVEVSGQASWGICNVAVAEHQAKAAAAIERADHLTLAIETLSGQLALGQAAQQRVTELEHRLREQERRQQQLQAECQEANKRAEELKHSSYHWWQTAEERGALAERLRTDLDGVYRSLSWRLSEPLRLVNARVKPVRAFAGRAVRWALRQPARLRSGEQGDAVPAASAAAPAQGAAPSHLPARRLSPRAARLYAELKQEVEKGGD
jgi:FkbM family methyltransferase